MQDNFKNTLLIIKKELSNYHRDVEDLSLLYLKQRLSNSLKSYYKEIKNSYIYLEQRDKVKIIKKINKYD